VIQPVHGRLVGPGQPIYHHRNQVIAVRSVCVPTDVPYRYVRVEGPAVEIETSDLERDRRPIARRDLGEAGGDRHIAPTRDLDSGLVRMRPERRLARPRRNFRPGRRLNRDEPWSRASLTRSS